jgi:transcription antitermination factor NusG
MPLFPNYLFVKASCREYPTILEHRSVIGFVKLGKEPAEVPNETLEIIKITINEKLELTRSQKEPGKGQQVVITHGPLEGFEGKVVDFLGKYFLLVELKQMYQYLMIRINIDSVLFLERNKIIYPDCVT